MSEIPAETRRAIVDELSAHEFRAGEFYEVLGRKHGLSAWSVRMIAVQAKRAEGRAPITGRLTAAARAAGRG